MLKRRWYRLWSAVIVSCLLVSCEKEKGFDPLKSIPTSSSVIMSLDMKSISYQLAWEAFTNWDKMNELKTFSAFDKAEKPEDLGLNMLEYYYAFVNQAENNQNEYSAAIIPIKDLVKFKKRLDKVEDIHENYTLEGYEVFETEDMAILIEGNWAICLLDFNDNHENFKKELDHLLNLDEHVANHKELKEGVKQEKKQAVLWLDLQKILKASKLNEDSSIGDEITKELHLIAGIDFQNGTMKADLNLLVDKNKALSQVKSLGPISPLLNKYVSANAKSYTAIHLNSNVWKEPLKLFVKKYEKIMSGKGINLNKTIDAFGEDVLLNLERFHFETKKVYDFKTETKKDKTQLSYDWSIVCGVKDSEAIRQSLDKMNFLMIFKDKDCYNVFGGMFYIKLNEEAIKFSNNRNYLQNETTSHDRDLSTYNFYHYTNLSKITNTLQTDSNNKWNASIKAIGSNIDEFNIKGFDFAQGSVGSKMSVNFKDRSQSSLFQLMRLVFGAAKGLNLEEESVAKESDLGKSSHKN